MQQAESSDVHGQLGHQDRVVAKPRMAEVLLNSGVHGPIAAAFLKGVKDLRGAAEFEACVTKCVRCDSVVALTFWTQLACFPV